MKVLAVVGTRPEAIKMAPVVQALSAREERFAVALCLTGQHREMLDQVVKSFGLTAQYDLDLMRPEQTIHEVTASVLLGMREVIEDAKPDVVLVHGDTTTSFAAALAAFYAERRLGHVEAGLRTRDKYQPFPEEMNRHCTDVLADYHYAPTERARQNLLEEGISGKHIVVTGNTVIDALLGIVDQPYVFSDPVLAQAGANGRRVLLVTAHRRESFGAGLLEAFTAIRDIVREHPDVEVFFPVHPNPQVRAQVNNVLAGQERIHLIEPLDYIPFVHLLKLSYLVLTDSGGIQEEAPSIGKPVLVMREVTERPEAVEAGTARLVGTSYDRIVDAVQKLLSDEATYESMGHAVNPYGDGLASQRIVDHLEGRAEIRHTG